MCLARSVAVAKAKQGMSKYAFHRMKQPQSVIQRNEAKTLCEMANIDPNQPCGLDEVRQLQNVLPDYRLCVFTDKKGEQCVFKGEYAAGRKNISLLLHNEHFHAILYPCQAFEFEFQCEKCVVFYNHKGDHRCQGTCWRCLGPNIHEGNELKRCPDCRHQFAGDECFQTHKTLKLLHSQFTKCDTFKFCLGCEKSYSTRRGQKHACGFVFCQYCKQNVMENHLCYMTGWEEREKKEKWNYVTVTYDIETTQYHAVDGKPDTFEHKPNLMVTQAVCDKCLHIEQNDYFCTICKNRQHIFHNLDDPNLNESIL
jgi:hypothetical protein